MVRQTLFQGAITMEFCSRGERWSATPNITTTCEELYPRSRVGTGGCKMTKKKQQALGDSGPAGALLKLAGDEILKSGEGEWEIWLDIKDGEFSVHWSFAKTGLKRPRTEPKVRNLVRKNPEEPGSSLVMERAFVSGSRVKVSLLLITMGKLAIYMYSPPWY